MDIHADFEAFKEKLKAAFQDLEDKLAGADHLPDDVMQSAANLRTHVDTVDDIQPIVVAADGEAAIDPTAVPIPTEQNPDADKTGTSAITKSTA